MRGSVGDTDLLVKKVSDLYLPAFLLKSMRSLSRWSYTEATSSKLKFCVLVIVVLSCFDVSKGR